MLTILRNNYANGSARERLRPGDTSKLDSEAPRRFLPCISLVVPVRDEELSILGPRPFHRFRPPSSRRLTGQGIPDLTTEHTELYLKHQYI